MTGNNRPQAVIYLYFPIEKGKKPKRIQNWDVVFLKLLLRNPCSLSIFPRSFAFGCVYCRFEGAMEATWHSFYSVSSSKAYFSGPAKRQCRNWKWVFFLNPMRKGCTENQRESKTRPKEEDKENQPISSIWDFSSLFSFLIKIYTWDGSQIISSPIFIFWAEWLPVLARNAVEGRMVLYVTPLACFETA